MIPVSVRTHTFSIPATERRVADARRTVLQVLLSWGVRDDAEESVLLVASELITNAVTHAGRVTPVVSVVLEASDAGVVRLGVRDGDPGRPRRVEECENHRTGGRGLPIVEALLEEYDGGITVERHDEGKTVWAEFGVLGFVTPYAQ